VTGSPPPKRRLPDGFVARLRPDLIRNTGDLLVGGSPLRALRLSPQAQACVDGGQVLVGDQVSAEVATRLLDGNLADPEPHGLDVDAAELTVVVPVRDRRQQLDSCLASLAPLTCIVVDDASHDPAAVAAVARSHGASLRSLTRNVGPAGARNAGLMEVRTPYVAFVDSDVQVTSDQLLGLAAHFADTAVALVGPLICGVSRSDRPRWFERYDTAASSLDLGQVGARVQPGAAVAWLPSACLVGRTPTLRAAGGFDERMRVGEDVDLVWRLVRAGQVVRYDPTLVAEHDTRATLAAWLGRKFMYGTGGAALARRHGDWTAPAVLSPTAAIGGAALLVRRPWSLPVAAGAAVLSGRRLQRRLPPSKRRGVPLAVDVAVRGLGWAARQESALLLRHWWPAAVVAGVASRNARRALVSALIVDSLVSLNERSGLDPAVAFAGRRLDDLAYGAGLWTGAVRHGSARCLAPRRTTMRSR
jgi:mycofactocin system glycosyltransferase